MRLAVTRAADKTHQIAIGVLGLREELVSLEDLIAMLAPELMLIAINDDGAMMGVAAMDLQLRSALIEAQTVGKIIASNPDDRPATRTDASMASPLLNAILAQMGETTPRTPLDGWGEGLLPGGLVADARAAGLVLPERSYRVVRMTLDLQAAERQGDLLLAMPDHRTVAPIPETRKEDSDWKTRFQATVNAAPVRLDAELHRFKMPLFAVRSIQVGQVLPLTGCHVTSVKLRARDGRKVATARLGQSGGMRAIRVERAIVADMTDLDQLGRAGTSDSLLMPNNELEFAVDGTAGGDDYVNDAMRFDDESPEAQPTDFGETPVPDMLEGLEAALASDDADNGADTLLSECEGNAETSDPANGLKLDWSDEGFDLPSDDA
jgi:flagellar motor switch protein FliM